MSEDKKTETGATIIAALASVPLYALDGLLLATLWRWVVVPLGVPAIGWREACVLMYVANWPFMRVQADLWLSAVRGKTMVEKLGSKLTYSLLTKPALVGIAWLYLNLR